MVLVLLLSSYILNSSIFLEKKMNRLNKVQLSLENMLCLFFKQCDGYIENE